MAEELGLEMAIRSLKHLLQYVEQNIRKVVPLALGLLCVSNPKVNVMDTISRLSHDTDTEVAMAAVISLGLIGAGTNNARIAGMLRNLSSFITKMPVLFSRSFKCWVIFVQVKLFAFPIVQVRISQGLVHMGTGLLTSFHPTIVKVFAIPDLDHPHHPPVHPDSLLFPSSSIALAGLATMLHACLDLKALILGKYHYVLYFLVLAMQPRMLMTVDVNLKPLSAPVRVGQAVDVVGQAGRPKTITGFQTHPSPVLFYLLVIGQNLHLRNTSSFANSRRICHLIRDPEYKDER